MKNTTVTLCHSGASSPPILRALLWSRVASVSSSVGHLPSKKDAALDRTIHSLKLTWMDEMEQKKSQKRELGQGGDK